MLLIFFVSFFVLGLLWAILKFVLGLTFTLMGFIFKLFLPILILGILACIIIL